ncbi:hypothetical protein ESY86_09575 [Subsaximicrobium wynnwilliamsii]|uniref:Uncharacterized protein n=2 Tax=Subsaximicrobium wynnwilliamsii TaxID=291179 RepID=A0A5C6ZHU3_9FLAO|nr:hypothetical protein ESY87_09235 [Subsaximicrobium wynnwilliamsii]TXD89311.1 hypothetical protein ESY86_09575 [Subsaximicrobium wynnwilliamsii]TXE03228.1 hypothetical protein ESY88_08945 [Subsaximicrobium wynnwilliamsii]
MIVVLILTTIVVGLAFSVLILVQRQMLAIQGNYQTNLELNTLETSLWLDFNRYSKITYDELEDELKFSTELDSISYRFYDKRIIKDRDTFSVHIKQKIFFLDAEEKEKGNIDAMKLEMPDSYQNKKLFVFKTNDAKLYMNN